MHRRRICVVTGTRAEFGLLRWLMDEIAADPELSLECVVTGSHLEPVHGETVREIEASGHTISRRVPILTGGDSDRDITAAFASAVTGLQAAFEGLLPDLVVLLGDRYEVLAAATASMFSRIPIAHLHGGESTEGLIDEAIRHSVTKLSHLHLTAHERYRQRVVQLGESPERVWDVGALGAEAALRTQPLGDEELADRIGVAIPKRVLTVTVHPLTLDPSQDAITIDAILAALAVERDALIVFTLPNADQNNRLIRDRIGEFVTTHEQSVARESLGQQVYVSLMRRSEAVVGNSSSGILEAPSLRVPTVDVGARQQGRIRADSVINCPPEAQAIKDALTEVRTAAFLERVRAMPLPFGDGSTSQRIAAILKSHDLEGILFKSFFEVT